MDTLTNITEIVSNIVVIVAGVAFTTILIFDNLK